MALQTLDFDGFDAPSAKYTPRILDPNVGKEFTERAQDGLNNNLSVWNISYSKRAGSEIEAVAAFLKTHRGFKAFYWVPPGQLTQKRFICKQYSVTYDHYTVVQSIAATLEEVPL